MFFNLGEEVDLASASEPKILGMSNIIKRKLWMSKNRLISFLG